MLALVVASAVVLVQVALDPTDQHAVLAVGVVLLLVCWPSSSCWW